MSHHREDDLTRFLEATEAMPVFGPPEPPRHYCPFCTETLPDRHSLSDHLSARHHGDRPVLLIAGREPDQTSTIRQSLRMEQIAVENCSVAHLRVNGIWQNEVSWRAVPTLLSREADAVIDLELVNRFDEVATPVHQFYRLMLRIPGKASVDAVDRAFIEHLATGTPQMAQVAAFLQNPRPR